MNAPALLCSTPLAALAFAASAWAADPETSLTVYSAAAPGAVRPELYRGGNRNQPVPGFAVVRQDRAAELGAGRTTVRFADVAALIDPTTVAFESLTDPDGTRVAEQNFQFDLVDTEKLLEKYLDREVSVDKVRGNGVETVTGTLLSTSGGLVLRRPDGTVELVNSYAGVRLATLPGGLITRPTLVWDVAAKRPGPHRIRVSYQTGGMAWWADYNLILRDEKGACALDVGAWVSLLNQSGASYPDARLKLVAGDVNRLVPPAYGDALMSRKAMAAPAPAEAGFAEKAFFEYHLYTLGRPTTLPDNSTKQIELFPTVHRVACEKALVYYGAALALPRYAPPKPVTDRDYGVQGNKKVDVYLRFRNGAERGLGMPLPAGRIRVSRQDSDGALEFIGEDAIDHTPRDETVQVKMGTAFDVVGERRQTDYRLDSSGRQLVEEIEVKLRNHKSEPVTVMVRENLYRWIGWDIVRASHRYQKADSRTVEFPVNVPAGGETALRYTVQYRW